MVDDKGRDLVPGLDHPTIATSLAGNTNESLAGIDVLGVKQKQNITEAQQSTRYPHIPFATGTWVSFNVNKSSQFWESPQATALTGRK